MEQIERMWKQNKRKYSLPPNFHSNRTIWGGKGRAKNCKFLIWQACDNNPNLNPKKYSFAQDTFLLLKARQNHVIFLIVHSVTIQSSSCNSTIQFFFSFHTDQIKLINFQFYLKDFFLKKTTKVIHLYKVTFHTIISRCPKLTNRGHCCSIRCNIFPLISELCKAVTQLQTNIGGYTLFHYEVLLWELTYILAVEALFSEVTNCLLQQIQCHG